jgi:biopolymer transport protein ExbB/TolQ
VSKATVTTMAGMVVAIAGMLGTSMVNRRLLDERDKLNDLLDLWHKHPKKAAEPAPTSE